MLLVALTSCATIPPGPSLVGQWGGNHVGLDLGKTSGRLAYDCASGTIDGPLVVDSEGRFAVTGHHTPGHGGPDRIDQVDPSFRAQYSGRLRGDNMTLTVRVENGVMIGPYSLRFGAEPTLMRCL